MVCTAHQILFGWRNQEDWDGRGLYWYDKIYMLTAIGLTPVGSSTVHIYTQTVGRTTQLTNLEECVPCPVFARYTLAFALQLRKEHGKTSVRVAGECRFARWKQNIQNRAYILTYSMEQSPSWETSWLQLVKKSPAFYGTPRFITALTSARHLSLSGASSIQSIPPHPTSRRSILILSSHLRLGLPSGLLPSGFPTKTLYTSLPSPIRATCPAYLIASRNQ